MLLKRCVFPFFAALICMALLILPQLADEKPLFAGAQSYLFYTRSASSQAQIVHATPENAAYIRLSLFDRTGESAFFDRAEDAFAQAEIYGARLLFTEKAGDVTNYYYYSPRLGECVLLSGQAVNLHIALRGESGCAGSPLIFGGY